MAKITWECPNCWTTYEIDERYQEALADKRDCKFCVRKDPNVPTTAEMDKLLTVEDMRNRFKVVYQCKTCRGWTTHDKRLTDEYKPCEGIINKINGALCLQINYDSTSMKSLRSYNFETDNKRRPKH